MQVHCCKTNNTNYKYHQVQLGAFSWCFNKYLRKPLKHVNCKKKIQIKFAQIIENYILAHFIFQFS